MPKQWYDVDTDLLEVPLAQGGIVSSTNFTTQATALTSTAAWDISWHFRTTTGGYTRTAVTPTSSTGSHRLINQGDGYYSLRIPNTGGTINNDTEGFGHLAGRLSGYLPFEGPTCGFRSAALNNSLIDAGTTGLLAPSVAGRTLNVAADGDIGGNVDGSVASVTGNVGGSVASVTAAVTVATASRDAIETLVWTSSNRSLTADVDISTGDQDSIVDKVWNEGATLHTTAGSFGAYINNIFGDTNELQTDDIPGLIAALTDIGSTEITDLIDTYFNSDTIALPGQGAPSNTPTIVTALAYLYKDWRNKKVQTATTYELYNDAGNTVDQKSTVSDDSTAFTFGEIGTGP